MTSYLFKQSNFLSGRRSFKGFHRAKSIGYFVQEGSVSDQKVEDSLLNIGRCSYVLNDSLHEDDSVTERPGFLMVLNRLKKGDELVVEKLDSLGLTSAEAARRLHLLHNQGISLRTIKGDFDSRELSEASEKLFALVTALLAIGSNHDEKNQPKKDVCKTLENRNLGGRPRTSEVKEKLVLRLRADGFSYRSIRDQTSISLSTIRRIIAEEKSAG